MNILEINNLTKKRIRKTIYRNINIIIQKGDCYAIIGADNEGKTTLLHSILGFNKPTNGTIRLFDAPKFTPNLLKRIGYVADDLLCFPKMTALKFLEMTIQLKGLTDCLDYAEELIDYFNISPGLLLEEMDEDMNKCVYIISALLARPEFLILDEPFNFLNQTSSDRLKQLITDYRKQGNTILITNEDYDHVAEICTRFTILKNRSQIAGDIPAQKTSALNQKHTEDTKK